MKKQNIQYINYNGSFTSNLFKINKLNSPESFDDYDINILDLSDKNIWTNNSSSTQNLNCISDINSIATMIKKTKNKILVVLPQNILFRFDSRTTYDKTQVFQQSKELKNNISLLNNIIEVLLGSKFNNSWLIYNKTKSKIDNEIIPCDFVFHNVTDEQTATVSTTRTSVTTINYLGKYFTTLNLKTEDNFMSLLKELKWISTEESEIPEWVSHENLLNDNELKNKKEKIKKELESLNKEITAIDENLQQNLYYKSILYKTGDDLVDVVNIMLKELIDYNYEDFVDKKEEDFLFENNQKFFIGEIKGINSNIKRSNITQTATHRNIFLEIEGNENKEVYAIAIINRQRTLAPNERDNVTEDVINLAKLDNVLIITSETFLHLFEMFKKQKITKEEIIKLLSSNVGILQLPKED